MALGYGPVSCVIVCPRFYGFVHTLTRLCRHLRQFNAQGATLFLVLLLCADFTFIGIHIIHDRTLFLKEMVFSLSRDGSYSELYQYVKFFWIIILLGYVARLTRSLGYVVWLLVFTYLLADDSLRIHETLGGYIAQGWQFTPPFNLRVKDFGELTVSALSGAVLLACLTWSYLRESRSFQNRTKDLLVLVMALGFCGIVVDMLHMAIRRGVWINLLLTIIEDEGEMIVLSLITWYIFWLSLRRKTRNIYLLGTTKITPISRQKVLR